METLKNGKGFHRDLWSEAGKDVMFSFASKFSEKMNYEKFIRELLSELRIEQIENEYLRDLLMSGQSSIHSMLDFVTTYLSEIREIDSVFFLTKKNVCYLWFVVRNVNEEVEEAIYSLKHELITNFNKLKFDIMLLPKTTTLTLPPNIKRIM